MRKSSYFDKSISYVMNNVISKYSPLLVLHVIGPYLNISYCHRGIHEKNSFFMYFNYAWPVSYVTMSNCVKWNYNIGCFKSLIEKNTRDYYWFLSIFLLMWLHASREDSLQFSWDAPPRLVMMSVTPAVVWTFQLVLVRWAESAMWPVRRVVWAFESCFTLRWFQPNMIRNQQGEDRVDYPD